MREEGMNARDELMADTHVRTELETVDERILSILRTHNGLTLEQMAASLTGAGWPQVFLAVDRLSRSGEVALRQAGIGRYQLFGTDATT